MKCKSCNQNRPLFSAPSALLFQCADCWEKDGVTIFKCDGSCYDSEELCCYHAEVEMDKRQGVSPLGVGVAKIITATEIINGKRLNK